MREGTIAEKEEKIEMEVEILESLRNRMFRTGSTTRMLLGDRVAIEFSPYDLDRGRIVYRLP